VATLLLTIAVVAACTSQPPRAADEARAPVAVRTATIAMSDLADTFETGGIVQARTTATVMSRILAPVIEVRVAPGARVRSGDVLIELDGRDLGARARSARAAAASAQQRVTAANAESRAADAALVLARTTHERVASLQAKRSATMQELDEATATLRAAEARAAAATARLQEATAAVTGAQADSEAATTTESFTRITAPFDGIVTEKMIDPGNMASPGVPLLRLEDTRSFRLEVRVDESRAGAIATGAAVAVLIDSGRGDAAQPLTGTVSEIARAVDSDARAFLVKIDLPMANGLRSGMFGRARFASGTRRALVIPREAIVRRGQVTSAFVVTDGVARLRLINVAGGEVLAGLSNGERVIVAPTSEIVDGRPVTEGGSK
jgi:multidrug efflux pump subunit AcrA (membrane-fusion protein)